MRKEPDADDDVILPTLGYALFYREILIPHTQSPSFLVSWYNKSSRTFFPPILNKKKGIYFI